MSTRTRSFLKWAGGKANLVERILPFLPSDLNGRKYYEPFVGGGSLFFATTAKSAVLSDLNEHLIHCYQAVKDSYEDLYSEFAKHAKANSSDYFYEVRDAYNKCVKSSRHHSSVQQAARFLYLNRASFNGIFRVNMDGQYNVPFGQKESITWPTKEVLQKASAALEHTELKGKCYSKVLPYARSGDFVYLDPPYPPLNGTSFFQHYTKDRFGTEDQTKLAGQVNKLNERGCLVLMSNADTPGIRELYKDWTIQKLNVHRLVTCKNVKHKVGEVLIYNYDISQTRLL
jgi:DNA adenine methylase